MYILNTILIGWDWQIILKYALGALVLVACISLMITVVMLLGISDRDTFKECIATMIFIVIFAIIVIWLFFLP